MRCYRRPDRPDGLSPRDQGIGRRFPGRIPDASGSTSICHRRSWSAITCVARRIAASCSIAASAFASPSGWQRFIQETCRSTEGRQAFQTFREQRRLAQAAPAKLELLAKLLVTHRGQRTLIFTADNATVYRIARQFLVPAITHQTKAKERQAILEAFPCRRVHGAGHEPSAQRGRGRAGRQRRHCAVRDRQRPRARAKARPAVAEIWRQASACFTRWLPAARSRNSPANAGGSIMRISRRSYSAAGSSGVGGGAARNTGQWACRRT